MLERAEPLCVEVIWDGGVAAVTLTGKLGAPARPR
jgi:hypothetical protein